MVWLTSQAWHDVRLFVEFLVDPGGDDLDFRIRVAHRSQTLGARQQVEEDDLFGGDAMVHEDLDGLDGGTASGEHRIEQEAETLGDVRRQFRVEQFRLERLLVPLDEDLAYPDRSAPSLLLAN